MPYSQDKNDSTPAVPPKSNSCVRSERKFEEIRADDTVFEQLREKAETKKNQLLKQAGTQQFSTFKNKVDWILLMFSVLYHILTIITYFFLQVRKRSSCV